MGNDAMTRIDRAALEEVLSRVQRPGRYIGGEMHAVVKEEASFRVALSYPDLYEIGMSNNGVSILYDMANRVPGVACERVFAVEADFEAALRASGLPLYTLETFTPLGRCDLIGFNVGHELLATNILQILDLGGVPLLRADRGEGCPVVMAGGAASSNPMPLSDFIDAFFIGDGEEGIVEVITTLMEARAHGLRRADAISRLGSIEGVYLPGAPAGAPGSRARKRVYRGADLADPPRPLVPLIRIAQERAVVEVTRGCGNFCNYCHAGFFDLPYRFYDHRAVARRVFEIVGNTGYNEVTLSSLSIGDYPRLVELVNEILPGLTEKGVSVSFPSLRVDRGTLPIIERISGVRRASLTFAVESASEAIRARARKSLFLDDLVEIVRHVRARGWKVIKFYFMLGLPGCREHDEAGEMVRLLGELHRAGGRGMDINVTVSPFVPKPHTPFQREPQMGREYFEEAVARIKRGLPRSIRIKNHDVGASEIEGVLSRGDARMGEVIAGVYREGCRFDSWSEHFRHDVWREVLDRVLPGWEEGLGRRDEAVLPWDMIATGFEAIARKRAGEGAGSFCPGRVRQVRGEIDGQRVDDATRAFEGRYAVRARVRVRFSKTGFTRFVPHNDFMEIVKRALRMAEAPVAMTRGFNKRERVAAGYPVPLGVESEAELVDIDCFDEVGEGFAGGLNAFLPAGIRALSAAPLLEEESIMASVAVVEYRVTPRHAGVGRAMETALSGEWEFVRKTRKGDRRVSGAAAVHSREQDGAGSIILRLYAGREDSLRIDDVVRSLAGLADGEPADRAAAMVKTGQYRLDGEVLRPL